MRPSVSFCALASIGFSLLPLTSAQAQVDVRKAAQQCRMLLASYQKGASPGFRLLAETNKKEQPAAIKAIFGNNRLQVNADGSAITYSPQIPEGGPGVLDSMCSASVKVFDKEGDSLSCSSMSGEAPAYYATFKRIRDNGWKPIGKMRVEFNSQIIEIRSRGTHQGQPFQVPCVVRRGSLNYFVSVTGLQDTSAARGCNPKRYFDSLTTKSVVVPKEWILGDTTIANTYFPNQFDQTGDRKAAGPVNKGDLVVIYNPGKRKEFFAGEDGKRKQRWAKYQPKRRWIYAIVGEGGPVGKWGEASIALNRELLNAKEPRIYRDVLDLDTDDQKISMLIFPKTSKVLKGRYLDAALVRRSAYMRFAKWGGGSPAQAYRRFKACEKYLINATDIVN